MAEQKKVGRPTTKKAGTKPVEKQDTTQVETKEIKQKMLKIPLDYVIPVRSGVQGGLVYVSRKNGYEVIWENYGSIEYMTYEEIVAMRNGHKRFFVDNWVFFEDTEDFTAEEIYKALQVDKYYTDILEINDIDELLSLDTSALEKKIQNVPNGIKDAIITRAKQLMIEGNTIMDSISKREMIERVFDVELIPKDI